MMRWQGVTGVLGCVVGDDYRLTKRMGSRHTKPWLIRDANQCISEKIMNRTAIAPRVGNLTN
jgi:hypothetical protein